jgi:trehalose synthase
MLKLDDYASIVGANVIEELRLLAEKLIGKSIVYVNSTSVGGGIAEILARMILLLKKMGVDIDWEVIKGNERFFRITKDLRNALKGANVDIPEKEWDYFLEVNRQNAEDIDLLSDIIFIHDPQLYLLWKRKRI